MLVRQPAYALGRPRPPSEQLLGVWRFECSAYPDTTPNWVVSMRRVEDRVGAWDSRRRGLSRLFGLGRLSRAGACPDRITTSGKPCRGPPHRSRIAGLHKHRPAIEV